MTTGVRPSERQEERTTRAPRIKTKRRKDGTAEARKAARTERRKGPSTDGWSDAPAWGARRRTPSVLPSFRPSALTFAPTGSQTGETPPALPPAADGRS